MRGVIVDYFHNIRMAKSVGYKTPEIVRNEIGYWGFENFMCFKEGDFYFRVEHDQSLFGLHTVIIDVDRIKVYEDGWIHTVPKEMRQKIKESVGQLKAYNLKCKENKLKRTYFEYQKRIKLEQKQSEIKKYEDEKRKLIEKFNKFQ